MNTEPLPSHGFDGKVDIHTEKHPPKLRCAIQKKVIAQGMSAVFKSRHYIGSAETKPLGDRGRNVVVEVEAKAHAPCFNNRSR